MRNTAEFPTIFRSAARILPLAALLAAGCDIKTSDADLVLMDPATASAKLHEPARMFDKAVNGTFVDPRSAKEYAEGHIPGAIHLPLADMKDLAGERLAGHNMFVVYDRDFSDIMGKAGAKRLLELGYKDVFLLRGGLKAWQKDGYSVATGADPTETDRGPVDRPVQGVPQQPAAAPKSTTPRPAPLRAPGS